MQASPWKLAGIRTNIDVRRIGGPTSSGLGSKGRVLRVPADVQCHRSHQQGWRDHGQPLQILHAPFPALNSLWFTLKTVAPASTDRARANPGSILSAYSA